MALLGLSACGDGSGQSGSENERPIPPNEYSVTPTFVPTTILYQSDQLAAPTDLAVIGDHLVILDPYGAPVIHLINRWTGDVVTRTGNVGEGPGEYQFARSVTGNGRDSIWVSDAALGRITVLAVEDLLDGESHSHILYTPDVRGEIERLSDGRFLASEYTGAGRFMVVNQHGLEPVPRGDGITPPYGVPIGVAVRARDQLLSPHPSRPLVAGVGIWTGEVLYYTTDGLVAETIDPPVPLQFEYTVSPDRQNPSLRPAPGSKRGYVGLATTNDFVVAVFSGRDLALGENAMAGRDLQVFDWTGGIQGIYRLDSDVMRIAIDPVSGVIYGTRWGTEPAIIRFDLPILRRVVR